MEIKSQSDSAINEISVDTNFLTAQRMVTEDPRGRRRRILAYGRSAHQQLTVFPPRGWCGLCILRVIDRYAPSSGLCAINTMVTQSIQDKKVRDV